MLNLLPISWHSFWITLQYLV